LIVFLHIPKTAGSSLKSQISIQYTNAERFFINGAHPSESLDELSKDSEALSLKAIYGHIDFGSIDFLNAEKTYVTILRHPLDRIVSHYYFVKAHKNHYFHDELNYKNLSLKDYLLSGYTKELNDGQTRMLIGAGGYHKDEFSKYDIAYGKTEEWMLNEAKQNIEHHFSFVGIQEHFKESMILMKGKLNWRHNVKVKSINKSKRIKISDIDTETIDIIKHYNQLDIQLYEWSLNRFHEELKLNKAIIFKEGMLMKIRNLTKK
jgi:hypothetical protein